MANGDISDSQISASSVSKSSFPWKGRLNNGQDGYWGALWNDTDPWIQVDLLNLTTVTGIITQGYVAHLQIQYGDSGDKLAYISENDKPKV